MFRIGKGGFRTPKSITKCARSSSTKVPCGFDKESILASHSQAVDEFVEGGVLTSPAVISACKKIDPSMFFSYKENPWVSPFETSDNALEEGAMSIFPYLVSLEILSAQLLQAKNVLDISCGSGFVATTIAEMLYHTNAAVFGVDRDHQKITSAQEIQQHVYNDQYKEKLYFIEGDAFEGYNEQAPYDVIHVGAAVDDVPETWLEQLRPGGVMTVPLLEGSEQSIHLVEKKFGHEYTKTNLCSSGYPALL